MHNGDIALKCNRPSVSDDGDNIHGHTKEVKGVHDVHEDMQGIVLTDKKDIHYDTIRKCNRPNECDEGDDIHGHTEEFHGVHEVHEDI